MIKQRAGTFIILIVLHDDFIAIMKMLLQSLRRGFEQENHLTALFMSAMFVDNLKMWLILICKWLSVDAVQKLTTEDVYLGCLF